MVIYDFRDLTQTGWVLLVLVAASSAEVLEEMASHHPDELAAHVSYSFFGARNPGPFC